MPWLDLKLGLKPPNQADLDMLPLGVVGGLQNTSSKYDASRPCSDKEMACFEPR